MLYYLLYIKIKEWIIIIHPEKYKYILLISELSSFSKAAKRLFIAQSSLSRYVNVLEDKLGVKLFDRSKLPIELTHAGTIYIQYIKEYLVLDNKLKEEFQRLANTFSGNLIIGSMALMGTYILPNIIPSFLELYPSVKININNETPMTFESSLENRITDICLTNLPPNNINIKYEIIGKDKVLLAASKLHPMSKKYLNKENSIYNPAKINFKDIQNEKFVLLPQPHNVRKISDSIFKDNHITPENIFEVPNLNMAIDLISAKMGFTFIYSSTISHKNIETPLAYFYVGKLENMASIILCYHKDNNNPLIESFIEISKKVSQQENSF